jgi:hypothetical protein
MQLRHIDQPKFGTVGSRLRKHLGDAAAGEYQQVTLVAAFAKRSGVGRIANEITAAKATGCNIKAVIGIDHGGTSKEGFADLLALCDELFVVHSTNPQVTFHTKAYLFEGSSKAILISGSSNLTCGGLFTNLEVCTEIEFDLPLEQAGLTSATTFLQDASDPTLPYVVKADLTNEQQIAAQLPPEIFTPTHTSGSASTGTGSGTSLFGAGSFPAAPPMPTSTNSAGSGANAASPGGTTASVAPAVSANPSSGVGALAPASSISVPGIEEGPTIWFETRKLTGGSRNILDLSMKSLVSSGDPGGTPFDLGNSKFMRGTVEFFGLDPDDTDQTKDITLRFEGVDYSNNTILFPVGKKANGTWRLQIKGTSPSGKKITSAFKEKGVEHYIVDKIITFTKRHDDFYLLSVFPKTELGNFSAASKILARNGSTNGSKRMGVL